MSKHERQTRCAWQDWNVTVYLEPGSPQQPLPYSSAAADGLRETRDDRTPMPAACHMPDVIEMPYRPPLLAPRRASEKSYTVCLINPPCRRRYRRLQLRRCARSRRPARLRRYGNLHHLQKQYLQRHAPARHLFPHSVRRYPQVSVVRLQRFQIQARQPVNATAKAAVTLKLVSSAVVNVLSVLFMLK